MHRVAEQLRVLRHRDFRNLWFAQSTSVIGDALVLVALALYVTDLTGSATDVGLVLGAQTLTFVCFLLIGGVWADRLPRARLMIATDIARGSLHALLAALIFLDAVEIWMLIVIEAGFGFAEAFFRPAHTGLLPQTVPAREIQEAQALSFMTANVAEVIGPALATVLVLGAGAGWAFAVDAATFAASALFMSRVRVSGREGDRGPRRTLLAEVAEGFNEVRSRPWIWVSVAAFALAVPLAYSPVYVLGPSIADHHYDLPALFGYLTTLIGIGAVAGALVGLRWRPLRPVRAAILALVPWPIGVVAFGLGAPMALVLVIAVAWGAGFALFDIWWGTAMAERVPAAALSRVSSYDWLGSLVFAPVGFLLAGPLAEASSPQTVLVTGGLLAAVVLSLALLPRSTRQLRRIDPAPG